MNVVWVYRVWALALLPTSTSNLEKVSTDSKTGFSMGSPIAAIGYNVDDSWLKLKTKEVEGFIARINTVDHIIKFLE